MFQVFSSPMLVRRLPRRMNTPNPRRSGMKNFMSWGRNVGFWFMGVWVLHHVGF